MKDDFNGFYLANFGDTVAMAYTYTADLGDAQDIAQEAFVRAWQRWTHVSRYENPVAWVRRVAVNLARSRWRRLRMSAAHLVRQHVPREVPGVTPDHVAVVAALRKLPRRQREAVVMHHMMDLPISEVAEHFEVPEGTVKSWLHRGRGALAHDLRLDVRAAVVTPAAFKHHHRVRRSAVAVVLALVLVGAGYLVTRVFAGAPAPVPPAVSPSPSPSVTDPMAAIDWTQATIKFDLAAEGCARGVLSFVNHEEGRPVAQLGSERGMVQTKTFQPAIGDLDGDGPFEAVLGVYCLPILGGKPQAQRLMVVSRGADGTLSAVAITSYRTKLIRSLRIESGTILASARTFPDVEGEVETLEKWRLTPQGLLLGG